VIRRIFQRLILASFGLALCPAPSTAQEAVAQFTAPGAAPDTELTLRSTTDIAVLSPALQAFVALYPEVRLNYEQWGSNALYAQSLAACAGDAAAVDAVFSSGIHQMVDLVNRACASAYSSATTAALPAARRWRDELWGVTKEAAVVIYNTDLVPLDEAPRTRFDLLDLMRRKPATYSGKIATYDIEASGLGYLFAFMDSQQATTFGGLLEGFSRVDAVATCCSAEIISGVNSGQYLLAYNVLGSYLDFASFANVGVIYPQDYTLFLSRAYMIPKTAQHPQNAALLLDFLLSAQGQAILADSNLVQRDSADETGLEQSIQRYISIDPTLLVAMDRQRRTLFEDNWRTTFDRAALP
jgi:ABC-type Fe3+ transport system substrate-binding protein